MSRFEIVLRATLASHKISRNFNCITMMRKALLLIIGLFLSISGYSQYMPDTTVQVCAYWSKGDKAVYEYRQKTTNKSPNGEETVKKTSAETIIVDILDSTETSYDLLLSYRDCKQDQDSNNTPLNETLTKLAESVKIKVKTDECGSILGIIDMGETLSLMDDFLVKYIDEVYAKNEQMSLATPKENFLNTMRSIITPEYLKSACIDELSALLIYHGSRMDINSEYEAEQRYSIGNTTIEGTMKFWVDIEESDSAYVVIRSYTKVDGDEILNGIKNFILPMVKNIVQSQNEDPNRIEEEYKKYIEETHLTATFEQYSTNVIHVYGGWTVDWLFDRVITISNDNGTNEITDSRSITLKDLQ